MPEFAARFGERLEHGAAAAVCQGESFRHRQPGPA
ncbi:hypothetical protein ACVJ5M_009250, partial [Bradyrhizobium sp. S3.7.6]